MSNPLTPKRLAEIDNVLNRIGLCYSDPDWRLPWSIGVVHDLRTEVTRLSKLLEAAAVLAMSVIDTADAEVERLKKEVELWKEIRSGRPQHVKYTCLGCGEEAEFTLTHMCHAPEPPNAPEPPITMPGPLTPERTAEIDEMLLRSSTSGYLLRLAGHDLWAEVTRLRKELTKADAVDELAKSIITGLKKEDKRLQRELTTTRLLLDEWRYHGSLSNPCSRKPE